MMSENNVILTICIIGKNEAHNLKKLVNSLEILKQLPFAYETIYVDSASTDDSVELARKLCNSVYVLKHSKYLCASAGRFIGTLKACGDWILYLDGDMALCPEFVPVLVEKCKVRDKNIGWVGTIRNIYPDGVMVEKTRNKLSGNIISADFGGAVLLPKKLVLKAGNWNPKIFSNEEIELYTRIRGMGGIVASSDSLMIEHFTEKFPAWQVLIGIFYPGNYYGKKFYGIGQILNDRIRKRTLLNFVRYFRYPFVYLGGVLLSLFIVSFEQLIPGILVFFLTCFYIIKKKGIKFIPLYTAFLVQAVIGYRYYSSEFTPTIAESFKKEW
jgi:glycosyltransferase involved in cell wall biosynthesis